MKHVFLSLSVIFLSLGAVAQTTIDGSQNTQLGGTISSQPETSGNERIRENTTTSPRGTYQDGYEQQRMEDTTSLTGGSLGGATGVEDDRRSPSPVGIGSGMDATSSAGIGSGL